MRLEHAPGAKLLVCIGLYCLVTTISREKGYLQSVFHSGGFVHVLLCCYALLNVSGNFTIVRANTFQSMIRTTFQRDIWLGICQILQDFAWPLLVGPPMTHIFWNISQATKIFQYPRTQGVISQQHLLSKLNYTRSFQWEKLAGVDHRVFEYGTMQSPRTIDVNDKPPRLKSHVWAW